MTHTVEPDPLVMMRRQTPSGQGSIQRVGPTQESRCVQAPRVKTTQSLPLGQWSRSIHAEETLRAPSGSGGHFQRNAARPAERSEKKLMSSRGLVAASPSREPQLKIVTARPPLEKSD